MPRRRPPPPARRAPCPALRRAPGSAAACLVPAWLLLAGCAVAPPAAPPAAPDAGGLDVSRACADGVAALLQNGLRITYHGAVAGDPQICLQDWDGRPHRLYLGFWDTGRDGRIDAAEREALFAAIAGPVGTEATAPASRAALFGRTVFRHAGNGTIEVEGQPRAALDLEVVHLDASGRPGARAETHYWIDRATGIAIAQETVVRMQDRALRRLAWRVEALGPADALAGGSPGTRS